MKVKNLEVCDHIGNALEKGHGLGEILRQFENSVIVYALEQCNGDRIKAADMLRIGVKNLDFKMEESGIADHFPKGSQNA